MLLLYTRCYIVMLNAIREYEIRIPLYGGVVVVVVVHAVLCCYYAECCAMMPRLGWPETCWLLEILSLCADILRTDSLQSAPGYGRSMPCCKRYTGSTRDE